MKPMHMDMVMYPMKRRLPKSVDENQKNGLTLWHLSTLSLNHPDGGETHIQSVRGRERCYLPSPTRRDGIALAYRSKWPIVCPGNQNARSLDPPPVGLVTHEIRVAFVNGTQGGATQVQNKKKSQGNSLRLISGSSRLTTTRRIVGGQLRPTMDRKVISQSNHGNRCGGKIVCDLHRAAARNSQISLGIGLISEAVYRQKTFQVPRPSRE